MLSKFVSQTKLWFTLSVVYLVLTPLNLSALYPNSKGYDYQNDNLSFYIGAKLGNTVSNSFGGPKGQYGYQALWLPTEMLASGLFGLNVGVNIFSTIRLEAESIFVMQRYKLLVDQTKFTPEVDARKFPFYGQESLSGTAIANIYYDMKYFSDTIYPYIGVGAGYGTVKFHWVDLGLQPNGMGEKYYVTKKTMIQQAMVGIEYETKIFHSAVFLEYRAIYAKGITVKPNNNGLTNAVGGEKPTEEKPWPPVGYTSPKSKDIDYFNHGLIFGMKFYIF